MQIPSIDQSSRAQEMQRPIFLSGRVVVNDGTPPPESVMIERVCNGQVRPEGYTDSKGRFSFQLGQNNSILPDASIGGSSRAGMGGLGNTGVNERDLAGCEIRAALTGYVSDAIPLIGRRSMDNPDLGTIILHRTGNVEGATISATSLTAPKEAQKAYDKGVSSMRNQKWGDARKQFEKAVGLYPQYAAAWFELGSAMERLGDREGARRQFEHALEIDGRFVKPYLQLAVLSAQDGNWEKLAETTSIILRLDPYNYPGIYYFDAAAQFNLRHLDNAEKSAREALKLDKANYYPSANHILGLILAVKGEFGDAAGYLKTYLRLAPSAADAAQVRNRLVEIERTAALPQGVAR
jgi:tetratricopeptide (TPR) repeat protein